MWRLELRGRCSYGHCMAEKEGPNIRSRQLGERLLQRMAEKRWGVRRCPGGWT